VKFHQKWRPAVHVHEHGAVFSKLGLRGLDQNTARSGFTPSTYGVIIFRRRFLNISEAPRTVKCHQSWRLAAHVHEHGAVFLKIGLIHGIDLCFRRFPPPFFEHFGGAEDREISPKVGVSRPTFTGTAPFF
jgi:hypothetical protein